MRIAFLMLSIFTTVPFFSYTSDLPFYKETQQFKVLCFSTEHAAADEILAESEKFFAQLSENLQHNYTTQITIKIYHDLPSFHDAIAQPNSADWVIGELQKHASAIVTPHNPGSAHSYESIIKANNTNLAELFIVDKYPHHTDIPRWLHQGVALYFADYFSDQSLTKFKNNPQAFPSFEFLEKIHKEDNHTFGSIHGFIASYLLVQFIDTNWSRTILLDLVDNYWEFEKTLRISKKDFEKLWIQFLQN